MFRIGQIGNESYLILCTLIWGGTFTMTIFGLRDTSPSVFLGLRFGIASCVFFPSFGKNLETVKFGTRARFGSEYFCISGLPVKR